MGRLRDEMPATADALNWLADAIGRDEVNRLVKAGMAGQPVFFAQEGDKTLGTPLPSFGKEATPYVKPILVPVENK